MKEVLTVVIVLLTLNSIGQKNTLEQQWKQNSNRDISELDIIEGIWDVKVSLITIDRRSGEAAGSDMADLGNAYIVKVKEIYIGTVIDYRNFVFSFSKTFSNNIFFYDGFLFAPPPNTSFEVELINNKIIDVEHKLGYAEKIELAKATGVPDYEITRMASNFDQVFILKLVKLYPDINALNNAKKPDETLQSGSGFALTNDGIIVTNNHVVSNAKNIKIRGVNNDFAKSYSAEILISLGKFPAACGENR